ncbi:APC family permease [Flaviflexus huanghaiensis]|uniref:APC family permease n=1 Tax=Flaviflexus huanghaiensis TaxID=1111473 RepID=UPI0015FD362E|nr:APC family permease [Flaviflexus huanghaiensis]
MAEPQSRLKQGMGGLLLFAFILGDVLGAGVYALSGRLAGGAGGMTWAPIIVALLMALLTAGSYAELVTKYPKAGGAAVFAKRAYKSPVIAFLVGYCMLSAGIVSVGALAIAFAGDYLSAIMPVPVPIAAPIFLAILALINMRGIKESVRTNLVMTIIETTGLVLVLVVVAIAMGDGMGDTSRLTQTPDDVSTASGILGMALLAFYSFVGFETSANVAEEVRDVTRVYPRALFGALLVAGFGYVLVAMASSIMLPPEELAESTGPLLDVVSATGVSFPSWLFSTIALVAIANTALMTSIMSSRLVYGMADEGLLPSVFTAVLPTRRTPWVAIIVTAALSAVLALAGELELLAEAVVLFLLFVFISTNLAVLVLKKDRVKHSHFTIPSPIPVLALGSCVVLLTQQTAEVWLLAAGLLIIGVVLYFVAQKVDTKGPHENREVTTDEARMQTDGTSGNRD